MSHMRTVFLVEPDEAETARRMERTLLGLSEDSGILFVSVSVIQDPKSRVRQVLYKVIVGCSRARDTSLIEFVVRTYLQELVTKPAQLVIETHRGLDRRSLST